MISSDTLTEVFIKAGVDPTAISFFDGEYELPSPNWITNDLAKAFNSFLFDMGIKWTSNQFDCNKFSKSASTIADWCWVKTRTEETALAFGMFCYGDMFGSHMLCVAIHCDTGDINQLRIAFYEPQSISPSRDGSFRTVCLTEKKLTDEDIKSCVACIFV